jgi:hypothetical protein
LQVVLLEIDEATLCVELSSEEAEKAREVIGVEELEKMHGQAFVESGGNVLGG